MPFGFSSLTLWQKAYNTGCFPASLVFMLFQHFLSTPPVYLSDAERETSKLLFVFAAHAAHTPATPGTSASRTDILLGLLCRFVVQQLAWL
jgi:hypothetical protein